MGYFLDDLRAFAINADQWITEAQAEGECRRTTEQGACSDTIPEPFHMHGICHQYLCVTHREMNLISPCLDYYLVRTHCVSWCIVFCVLCIAYCVGQGSSYRWYGHVLPGTRLIKIMCVHQLYNQG